MLVFEGCSFISDEEGIACGCTSSGDDYGGVKGSLTVVVLINEVGGCSSSDDMIGCGYTRIGCYCTGV